ncbi:MAG: hypothetical protein WDN31_21155, partial [Hyphomicrobium sp.]
MPTAPRLPLRTRTGLWALLAACSVLPAAGVLAQAIGYRTPDQVPPSWVQFSKLVKYRFEQWIGSDDPIAARFRVYVKVHTGPDRRPPG